GRLVTQTNRDLRSVRGRSGGWRPSGTFCPCASWSSFPHCGMIKTATALGDEEGECMSRYDLYAPRYPLLPLKNVVIFPRNIVTLLVGRPRSIQAVEEAMARDKRIVVTAHRD